MVLKIIEKNAFFLEKKSQFELLIKTFLIGFNEQFSSNNCFLREYALHVIWMTHSTIDQSIIKKSVELSCFPESFVS